MFVPFFGCVLDCGAGAEPQVVWVRSWAGSDVYMRNALLLFRLSLLHLVFQSLSLSLVLAHPPYLQQPWLPLVLLLAVRVHS